MIGGHLSTFKRHPRTLKVAPQRLVNPFLCPSQYLFEWTQRDQCAPASHDSMDLS